MLDPHGRVGTVETMHRVRRLPRPSKPSPAVAPDVVADVPARLARLQELLAANPSCAVGVFDPARNMRDAPSALSGVGIEASGHSFLKAGALIEFLDVADVRVMSDAAAEASVHGTATRTVTLRDGQPGDLHLFELGGSDVATVAVIVPGTGTKIAPTPAPTAIAASPRIGVVKCNAFGAITNASASTLVLLGRPGDSIEGISAMEMIHADDQEMAVVNWLAAKEQRGVSLRWRCRLARADGSLLWTEVTITNSIKPDGSGDVELNLYDITREVAATEALIAERELIALVTETLPVGVAKFDLAGHLEHANGRLSELLSPLDPAQLLARAVRGDLADDDLAAAFAAFLRDGSGSRLIVDHDGVGGVRRHLEWTIRAAFDADGAVSGGVLCIADVTEAAQLREALESRAMTDALTGCLNRAGTIAALESALADARHREGLALLFIDLNDFKGINDSHGHAVGDAVLEVVAGRLRRSMRADDLVGRLGGDEFVVIAPGLRSASEALDFADRVSRQLQGTATIGSDTVPILASIGVAWTSRSSATELLAAADAAMYIAKQTRATGPVLSEMANGIPIVALAAS